MQTMMACDRTDAIHVKRLISLLLSITADYGDMCVDAQGASLKHFPVMILNNVILNCSCFRLCTNYILAKIQIGLLH